MNFKQLLEPIADDSPVGADPRQNIAPDALYPALRDARISAGAAERKADTDDDAETPLAEWKIVFDLAVTLLRDQAKDLDVVAWLIDASVRLHGFAGLRDGFLLAQGLIERYWDTLFPLPDEDGVATRVSAFARLNGTGADGTLILAVRKVPLTEASSVGPYTLWDYMLARRQRPSAAGRPPTPPKVAIDQLRQAARQSSAAFMRAVLADLAAARNAFQALSAALDKRCGADAPPSSAIRNVLDDAAEALADMTQGLGLAPPAEVVEAAAQPIEAVAEAAAPAPLAQPQGISTREEAFQRLEEVAEFFRRSEPHSPISYAIEDMIRRGRMTLPELLIELLPDQAARNTFMIASGIRPKPAS